MNAHKAESKTDKYLAIVCIVTILGLAPLKLVIHDGMIVGLVFIQWTLLVQLVKCLLRAYPPQFSKVGPETAKEIDS